MKDDQEVFTAVTMAWCMVLFGAIVINEIYFGV